MKNLQNTEEKETLLARKYFITSLENRNNDLQNTVTVLNNLKESKAKPLQSGCQQSAFMNSAGHRETSVDFVLRSVENKLYMFEAQLMNNVNLQNQLNFQNYINIQNQMSVLNMHSQISSVQAVSKYVQTAR